MPMVVIRPSLTGQHVVLIKRVGASTSPGTVFPNLMNLHIAHLGKFQGGEEWKSRHYRGWIEEIVDKLNGNPATFPAHLNLIEQGSFAIGYYHQRRKFFEKKEKPEGANV